MVNGQYSLRSSTIFLTSPILAFCKSVHDHSRLAISLLLPDYAVMRNILNKTVGSLPLFILPCPEVESLEMAGGSRVHNRHTGGVVLHQRTWPVP
jgi:hypothetical protein